MEYGGNRSTDTMYCCGFSPKPTRDKPLVVDGISLPLIEDENFQVFDARLHPKHSKPQRHQIPSKLLCAVAYSADMKELPERSSTLIGEVTVIWGAACYSLLRRFFLDPRK